METIADIWGQAAGKWTEVVAQVGHDDWSKPTPCEGWTVRELVDHTMQSQTRGAAVVGADVAPDADWSQVQPAMQAALADPANLEGNVEAFGGMPTQAVVGLVTGDLLIHSWDLARSIGADEALPPAAVEATLMGLQRMPDPMLRSSGMFAAAVEVADDAGTQDALIAFVGRTP